MAVDWNWTHYSKQTLTRYVISPTYIAMERNNLPLIYLEGDGVTEWMKQNLGYLVKYNELEWKLTSVGYL